MRHSLLGDSGLHKHNLVLSFLPALSDGARNLIRFSEQFDNAVWTKERSTVSANSLANPLDASVTADTLIEDATAANTHRTFQTCSYAASVTYTLSVYAKAKERTGIVVEFPGAAFGGTPQAGKFNLSTGASAVRTGTPTVAAQSIGSGWYRCTVSATASTAAASSAIIYLSNDDGTTITYNGDGVSGVYLWGAMLNTSLTAFNYVLTDGKQTILDLSGGGLNMQLGATSGVDVTDPIWAGDGLLFDGSDDFVIRGAPTLDDLTVIAVVNRANTAANHRIALTSVANTWLWVAVTGGTNVSFSSDTSVAGATFTGGAPTGWNDLAITWDNVMKRADAYLNGNSMGGAILANALVSGGNLTFGSSATSFNGSMAAMLLYRCRLTPYEIRRNHRALRRMLGAAPTSIVLP